MSEIAAAEKKQAAHLAVIDERHQQTLDFADVSRQHREAEREHHREITEERIKEWKKRQRQRGKLGADFDKASERGTLKSAAIAKAIADAKEKQEEDEKQRSSGGGHGRSRQRTR